MNQADAVAALDSIPEVERIQVASLRPGDVVVFEFPGHISAATAERIEQFAKDVWPNNKAVVLCDGMHMKIVRGEDA